MASILVLFKQLVKYSLFSFLYLFLLSIFLTHSSNVSAQITYRFVKHDATGNNDGTSWENAFSGLEPALNAASANTHIWVAAGTYHPVTERGGTGERFRAFALKNQVEVYGGFSGSEDPAEFDLTDRNFTLNETVISGNIGSDVNVYHVFRHENIGLNASAVLDGVTVTGGISDGSVDNNQGGGMLNLGSSSDNGSSPTVRHCVFISNYATEGGAVYNGRYCNPEFSFTAFSENVASNMGGAVYNHRNTPEFYHCTFTGNAVTGSASNFGGGAIYNTASNAAEGPLIDHCIFNNNRVSLSGDATYGGGAIYSNLDPGRMEITQSAFTGNEAKYGGALYHRSGSHANRMASDIRIESCFFEENLADYGGAIFSDRHNSIVTSCFIRGNEAYEQAGGFYSRYASSRLYNTLLSGNKAGKHGGGIYLNNDTTNMVNSTITGNYSGERGGGISIISSSKIAVYNTIVWNNASPEGNQLWSCSTCEYNIDHSLYGNSDGDVFITSNGILNSTNNLHVDPVFLNPYDAPTASNTPNVSGSYFICGCTSPVIDAGENSHLPVVLEEDIRGAARIMDGNNDDIAVVDLGAFEFDPNGCNALEPSDGEGTPDNPYRISLLQHLYWVSVDPSRWDKHYLQTAHIDACNTENWFNGNGWNPIGNNLTKFSGTYNGQGFTISNLFIKRSGSSNVGLFGAIGGQSSQKSIIKNLSLLNVNIEGRREVGGLVGMADQHNNITNCHVSGIVKGERNVGGLAGWGRRTEFFQCSSSAAVELLNASEALYHGGLIGHINTSSSVKECFSTGNVSGRSRIGGLIGAVGWASIVEDSYARGNTTAAEGNLVNPMIGGLIGEVWNGEVKSSYSTGEVDITGLTSEYGGMVGTAVNSPSSADNFWDTATSGLTQSAIGTAKTTLEMKIAATFTDIGTPGLTNPWDFESIWVMNEENNEGYPYLQWRQFLFTWSGNSTEWSDPKNWDLKTLPGNGDHVMIPSTPNNPILDQSFTVKNMEIGSNADLTINMDVDLTLVGTLHVYGTLLNEGDLTINMGAGLVVRPTGRVTSTGIITNNADTTGLRVESDHTGTGSIIVNNTGVKATVQRYVEGGKWHVISSPAPGQRILNFMQNGQNNIPQHAGAYGITDYIENKGNNSGGWGAYFNNTTEGSFVPGKGYLIRRGDDGPFHFSGELEGSDVHMPVSKNANGWNAIGNPFASALKVTINASSTDAFLVQNANQLDPVFGGLYIYDPDNNRYNIVNNSPGSFQNYLQSGQAFLVKSRQSGGNVLFSAEMRSHDNDIIFHKKSTSAEWGTIRLTVTGKNKNASTFIAFNSNMSKGIDATYDAGQYGGDPELNLYSMLVHGNPETKLAIQCLPDNDYYDMVIPLGFDFTPGGEVTFSVESVSLSPEASAVLEDRVTGVFTDLENDNSTVSLATGNRGAGRFFLHTNSRAVSVENPETENIKDLNAYFHNKAVYIKGLPGANSRATLYDLAGIVRKDLILQPTFENSFETHGLKQGVYVLRVTDDKKFLVKRLYIY